MSEVSKFNAFLDGSLGRVGRHCLALSLYLVDLCTFVGLAFRDWLLTMTRRKPALPSSLVPQIIFSGIDGLFITTSIGLILGLTVIFKLIAFMSPLIGSNALAGILIDLIAMELNPLICAVILISRSGSAMAVDIGNMRLSNEIQSLEDLGININDIMLFPRMLALSISQLILALYFTFIALTSSVFLSGFIISVNQFELFAELIQNIELAQVAAFTMKNLVFGYIIAAVACFHGMQVQVSSAEVLQQTQKSIVNALLLIFLTDGIFVLLLL